MATIKKYDHRESPRMQVYLVDDDADDRTFFSDAFAKVNLDLHTDLHLFENGMELMDHLKKDDIDLPHIIFLDLNMPLLSGKECLREIRQVKRFDDVSIAIYSTSDAPGDIEDTFSGGANIYLRKPLTFEELTKTIRHVLKLNWQYHMAGMSKETFFLSI